MNEINSRVKIRTGTTNPTTSNLLIYELGYNRTAKNLFINNNGTIENIGGPGTRKASDISYATATSGMTASTNVQLAIDKLDERLDLKEAENKVNVDDIVASGTISKILNSESTSTLTKSVILVNASDNASALHLKTLKNNVGIETIQNLVDLSVTKNSGFSLNVSDTHFQYISKNNKKLEFTDASLILDSSFQLIKNVLEPVDENDCVNLKYLNSKIQNIPTDILKQIDYAKSTSDISIKATSIKIDNTGGNLSTKELHLQPSTWITFVNGTTDVTTGDDLKYYERFEVSAALKKSHNFFNVNRSTYKFLYFINPSYTGSDIDGNEESPYKSFAAFLTANGTKTNIGIVLENCDNEDITITGKTGWSIFSYSKNKSVNENIKSLTIDSNSNNITILGINVLNTTNVLGNANNISFNECFFNLFEAQTDGIINAENCYFNSTLNINLNQTTGVFNSSYNEFHKEEITNINTGVFNSFYDKYLSCNIIRGSLKAINTLFYESTSLNGLSIQESNNAGFNNFLYIYGGCCLNSQNNWSKIQQIDLNTKYSIGGFIYDKSNSVLNGIEEFSGFFTDQIKDLQNFVNISPVSQKQKDINKAFDDNISILTSGSNSQINIINSILQTLGVSSTANNSIQQKTDGLWSSLYNITKRQGSTTSSETLTLNHNIADKSYVDYMCGLSEWVYQQPPTPFP